MQEKKQYVQVKLLKIILWRNINKTCTAIPDTDSIHTLLPIEECKKFCDIDEVEIGKWKHEASFSKARFIRQKCYIEKIIIRKFKGKLKYKKPKLTKNVNNYTYYSKIKITCAGLPQDCYDYVTWDNFREGFSCPR